ncbi:MAG: hypothetical protein ACR2QV_02710 [Gammaproteobacteria bacterium]
MSRLAIACATGVALLLTSAAQAAVVDVVLSSIVASDGSTTITAASITGTTTGTYDTGTGIVTMDSGTTAAQFNIGPSSAFTHLITDWTTGAGGYSATSYQCIEGTFGGLVGGSLCGGYNFGDNGSNESILSYASMPGVLIIGGDDFASGTVQQGTDYATSTISFGGGTLFMETANFQTTPGVLGVQLTFVPVPAAAWLFGSALALLGLRRRKNI